MRRVTPDVLTFQPQEANTSLLQFGNDVSSADGRLAHERRLTILRVTTSPERSPLTIIILVSDSRNAKGWLLDGWKINVAEVRDVVERVVKLGGPGKIARWHWVKGHAGSAGNTQCDRACRQAAGGDLTGLMEIPF